MAYKHPCPFQKTYPCFESCPLYIKMEEFTGCAFKAIAVTSIRNSQMQKAQVLSTIEFPNLTASVAEVDDSLNEYLNDSIKRAAAKPFKGE